MTVELENLIAPGQAMKLLHVSRATFYKLLREGRLPAIRLGKSWRFRPSALAEFIHRQERQHAWRRDD